MNENSGKVGRKVILSEAQFKEYVKRQLNESMMGEGVDMVSTCNDYAERLIAIANQVREIPKHYDSFFKTVRQVLEKMGIGVRDARSCVKYGDLGIMMYVDTSNFQIPEDYEENDRDFCVQNEIEDSMSDLLSSQMGFGEFFEDVNVYCENGVVIIAPELREGLSLINIESFLSNF